MRHVHCDPGPRHPPQRAVVIRETLILLVIPARRFTTAEWLVKPEPILILFQWNQGQIGPRRTPGRRKLWL